MAQLQTNRWGVRGSHRNYAQGWHLLSRDQSDAFKQIVNCFHGFSQSQEASTCKQGTSQSLSRIELLTCRRGHSYKKKCITRVFRVEVDVHTMPVVIARYPISFLEQPANLAPGPKCSTGPGHLPWLTTHMVQIFTYKMFQCPGAGFVSTLRPPQ